MVLTVPFKCFEITVFRSAICNIRQTTCRAVSVLRIGDDSEKNFVGGVADISGLVADGGNDLLRADTNGKGVNGEVGSVNVGCYGDAVTNPELPPTIIGADGFRGGSLNFQGSETLKLIG